MSAEFVILTSTLQIKYIMGIGLYIDHLQLEGYVGSKSSHSSESFFIFFSGASYET